MTVTDVSTRKYKNNVAMFIFGHIKSDKEADLGYIYISVTELALQSASRALIFIV